MSEDIVKDSIKCLANMEVKETTYQVARDIVLEEIHRLNSIIKEVREYIEENMSYIEKGKLEYIPSGEELLEILDKAGDSNDK